jgi:sulfur-carrier protein
MKVNVKLFANFRDGRFVAEMQEHPAGTRIADVVRALNIQEAEIGMIMLNNRHAELDQQLADGNNLSIFPLVGGG